MSNHRVHILSCRVDLLALIPLNHDHLQAYSYMDISLDTFPYAGNAPRFVFLRSALLIQSLTMLRIEPIGTTTTCEALWMGVPVITLMGDNHAHNVGATILRQVGHEELIAHTKESYILAALHLASDTQRLHAIRRYSVPPISYPSRAVLCLLLTQRNVYSCAPQHAAREDAEFLPLQPTRVHTQPGGHLQPYLAQPLSPTLR
jgi:hypothetical protein